ncbi:MAG: hybrid sensor histidine kinase/response regulator [Thermodesulfobacteriota bacterium]
MYDKLKARNVFGSLLKTHPIPLIRLLVFTGLCLTAPGVSSVCISSDASPPATVFPEFMLWTWFSGFAILFFCMLMAIILLWGRLRKTSRDLRDEKQKLFIATEKAARNERLVKEIYDNTNDVFFFHDLDGNMKEVNTSGLRESGYTIEQWQQYNIRDLVPDRMKRECDLYLDRIMKNEKDRGYMMIRNQAGEEILLEYNNSLVKDAYGRPTGVRGIARNITEQHNARKALKKSEEKYRTILDSIEDAYYEVDLVGRITFFNNAALHMLGYTAEELAEKNYRDLVHEKDKKTIFDAFNYVYRTRKPVKAFDWRLVKADKTICHVETSIAPNLDKNNIPIGFLGIIRDLTDRLEGEKRRRELESQLHQSQKLESIGTLAGGIAHDFNNILFPIIGYTEMAMEELPADSPLRDNLKKVMKSAARAKSMIQQILAFSRQRSDESGEAVRIEPFIKETVKLLRNTFPSTIEIQDSISKETGMVSINLSSLRQVIMNLCTNALHAMEDQSSGKLDITVEPVRITETDTANYQNLTSGEYVGIRIADTGEGIPLENMGKIFEPYFTTKPQDKGTGLGLSVSYGIIKNAGGIITVNSTAGIGTQFDILLPVVDREQAVSNDIGDVFAPLPTGKEYVLLVDDEHRIVELEKQMIESLGYRVFSRTSSIEALEAFKYDPQKFDIVITDQTMPNMTGKELAKELLDIRPDIPVIICTGFSEKVTVEKIKNIGIKAVLTKPIPKADMAVTLRRVLDEKNN